MIRNALKTKVKEDYTQIDRSSVNRINSSFADRWSFSYTIKTPLTQLKKASTSERLSMVCAPVRRDNPRAKAGELSNRTGGQTMLYVTCTMIHSVDLACYGVSHAKNLGMWALWYK